MKRGRVLLAVLFYLQLWTDDFPAARKQMRLALENIALHASNKRVAYENIIWALINTKEFVFNQ